MEPIAILINGLPGNVAQTVLAAALRNPRFRVLPYSMTGPEIPETTRNFSGITVHLVSPEHHESHLSRLRAETTGLIGVDYTHPSAVNRNAEIYCRIGLPFVMGTTGGDRERLADTVRGSNIAAVIAPNMAKPIVGLQAMLEWAASQFPGLFSRYTLRVRESHQKGKADTSGTAKAMVAYFNTLGAAFDPSLIEMVRDPEVQMKTLGVPEANLGGHGWHTYTLCSQDGTVKLEFTHNINGREVYSQGTLDAVAFLADKVRDGAKARVYSMIDVLAGHPKTV